MFSAISTLVGYSMPNPIPIYMIYVWFTWAVFNGISTLEGYLMPNPIYIYIYIYMICK